MPSPIAPIVIMAIAQATVETPVVTAPPQPPPLQTVRPAPPPPPIMISAADPERAPRLETFRAEILAGREVLWAGDIAVSDRQQASFSQSLRQPSKACSDGTSRDVGQERNELRLSLTFAREHYNATVDPNQVAIDVTWQRALPGCAGQASVGFNRSISVASGATETVVGDAGLAVRLTRARSAN